MAASGGIFAPIALRILRQAFSDASKVLRKKAATVSQSVSTNAGRQPIHPVAVFRQQRRLFSSGNVSRHTALRTARRWLSSATDAVSRGTAQAVDRSQYATSKTARYISQFSGRAPFASTLRPNLTGGTLPRSAGGYGITGGGARYFSHTPAAPAEVVQNVSQAMRAFFLSGQRTRFDGIDAKGNKRYRVVSALEDETMSKMSAMPRFSPGSFIDFRLSPTITAMSPLTAAFPFAATAAEKQSLYEDDFIPTAYTYAAKTQQKLIYNKASPTTLNADGFLKELSVDFGRALKDLSATLEDIRKLSSLGDLTIELVPDAKMPTLRVRFPGTDAATVGALCDDVGVTRGLVGQDKDFDASAGVPVALKFPFAPDCENAKTLTSPGGSVRSLEGHELEDEAFDSMSEVEEDFLIDEFSDNPWISSPEPEGYESLSRSSLAGSAVNHCSEDFEGIEGVYRFIEECDRARTWVK